MKLDKPTKRNFMKDEATVRKLAACLNQVAAREPPQLFSEEARAGFRSLRK